MIPHPSANSYQREFESFTSLGFNVVREARIGRRAVEALAGPLVAFDAARQVVPGSFAEMSFEAASGKAPGDMPRLEAASEVAGSFAVAVLACTPFEGFRTGTVAQSLLLPRLASSARSLFETEHTACNNKRPVMPWSVELSNVVATD